MFSVDFHHVHLLHIFKLIHEVFFLLTALFFPQVSHHKQCKASTYNECCNNAQHNTCNHSVVVGFVIDNCTNIEVFPIYRHLQQQSKMLFYFYLLLCVKFGLKQKFHWFSYLKWQSIAGENHAIRNPAG